jgi:hypothetical protein
MICRPAEVLHFGSGPWTTKRSARRTCDPYAPVPREEVRKAFQAQAAALAATLRAFTPLQTHKPTIGTGREQAVIDALSANFGGLSLTRGQIHAPAAEPSSEWDIIVADAASGPLAGMPGAYPIESVLAVVSIKSRLDGAAVDDCSRAAAQLRTMDMVEVPGALRPAVFALALDGLNDAYAAHGPNSVIDGVIVLERRIALASAGGYDVFDNDDAYGRWLAAIDHVLRTAPRRAPVLASYLFDVGSEPEDEPPSGPLQPSSPKPSVPSAPGAVMQACATRADRADLRSSRMMRRLAGELESSPAAVTFDAALDSVDGLVALSGSASGRLLDVTGRALTAFNRDAEAATAMLRYAEEPGADRARALAFASASWRAAGDAGRAEDVLADAVITDDGHPAVRLQQISRMSDAEAQLKALDGLGTLEHAVDQHVC